MPTFYVDPNATIGGDGLSNALTNDGGGHRAFQSLSECEASRNTAVGGSALTAIEEWICSTNGGAADDIIATIDGWTATSAAYYIDIKVDAAYRHNGSYDTSKYRLANGNNPVFAFYEQYTRLDGLIFKFSAGSAGAFAVVTCNEASAANSRISNCVIDGNGVGTGTGLALGDSFLVYNTFVYNCTADGIIRGNSANPSVYNCTARACGTGFRGHWSATMLVRNCLADGCTTGFADDYAASSSHNAASDATAPGTSVVDNVTLTFTTSTSCILAASGNDEIIDDGVDLSGTFTTDILGVTRSGTWDIGAYEYVAAGGSTWGALLGLQNNRLVQ